jgi:hypothetical protein
MALFRASTKITLGNGEKTSFWHDNWCAHGPLQQWTPEHYRIATRKKRSVAKETIGNNWILFVTSMPVQLSHYLEIWDFVHALQLVPEQTPSLGL